ncbi:hypothetical protein LTR66_014433 [Elasticomyces elasticus]|nr:hypothetical protein LTR66_014433 [Elasticomyces elasticus]KAK5008300.1 hypothetical protein LTR28_004174 [Elasticomyces elasticus]
MSLLESLPIELVAHVLSFVEPKDLLSVRLTCLQLSRISLPLFGEAFFSTIGFMVSSHSLATLEAISEHVELRKYLRHLWIAPDMYSQELFSLGILYFETANDMGRAKEESLCFAACTPYMTDNERLISSGGLACRLEKAFRHFPKLETLGMRHFNEEDDLRSYDYDAIPDNQRCLGRTRLFVATGRDPLVTGKTDTDPDPDWPDSTFETRSFAALLSATARSDLKPKNIYTCGPTPGGCIALVQPDHLGLSDIPPESLSSALACLESFHICVIESDSFDRQGAGLASLLNASRALQHLSLRFHESLEHETGSQFNAVFTYLAAHVTLPSLRRLSTAGMAPYASLTPLVPFLRSTRDTLHELEIHTCEQAWDRVTVDNLRKEDFWLPELTKLVTESGCKKLKVSQYNTLLTEDPNVLSSWVFSDTHAPYRVV